MASKESPVEPTATEGQTDCWDRFAAYRKDVYAYPDGGQGLVQIYNNFTDHYTKDSVALGYFGPANLAAMASEYVSDKSARILDAASGSGMVGEERMDNNITPSSLTLCKLANGRGFTCVDALDPSQDSLDYSNRHHSYTEHICDTLDEHQTKIKDDQYDAVLMCGAFGVPGHVTDACFPEIIRIIKPGGYFLFTVSEIVLEKWSAKMDAAIEALRLKGAWELIESRMVTYFTAFNEKAEIVVLKINKK